MHPYLYTKVQAYQIVFAHYVAVHVMRTVNTVCSVWYVLPVAAVQAMHAFYNAHMLSAIRHVAVSVMRSIISKQHPTQRIVYSTQNSMCTSCAT